MKEKIFVIFFISFLIYMLVDNEKRYKEIKHPYYECTGQPIPITTYEYSVLLRSKSLQKDECKKVYYTRFHANIIRKKK